MSKEKTLKELLKPEGMRLLVVDDIFVLANPQTEYSEEADTLKELFNKIQTEIEAVDNG